MGAAASRRARLLLLVLVLALPPARLFGQVHAHSSRPILSLTRKIGDSALPYSDLQENKNRPERGSSSPSPQIISLACFLALSWKFAQPIGPRFKKADNSHFPPPRHQQATSISSPLKSLLTSFFFLAPPSHILHRQPCQNPPSKPRIVSDTLDSLSHIYTHIYTHRQTGIASPACKVSRASSS